MKPETTPRLPMGWQLNGYRHILTPSAAPGAGDHCVPCCAQRKTQWFLCDNGDVWAVTSEGRILRMPYGDDEFQFKFYAPNYVPWRPHVEDNSTSPIGRPKSSFAKPYFRDYIGFQVERNRCIVFWRGELVYDGEYDGRGSPATFDSYSCGPGWSRYTSWTTKNAFPFVLDGDGKITWEDANDPRQTCDCPPCEEEELPENHVPDWRPKRQAFPKTYFETTYFREEHEMTPGEFCLAACGYKTSGGPAPRPTRWSEWTMRTDGGDPESCPADCGGGDEVAFPTASKPRALQEQCDLFNENNQGAGGFYCRVDTRCEERNCLWPASEPLGFQLYPCGDTNDLVSFVVRNNLWPTAKWYRFTGFVNRPEDIPGWYENNAEPCENGYNNRADNGWIYTGDIPEPDGGGPDCRNVYVPEIGDTLREHWRSLFKPYGAAERGLRDFDVVAVAPGYEYGKYRAVDSGATVVFDAEGNEITDADASEYYTDFQLQNFKNEATWYFLRHGEWVAGEGTFADLEGAQTAPLRTFLYRDCRAGAESPDDPVPVPEKDDLPPREVRCAGRNIVVPVLTLLCCENTPLWAVNVGSGGAQRVHVGYRRDELFRASRNDYGGYDADGNRVGKMEEEWSCCNDYIFLRVSVGENTQRNMLFAVTYPDGEDAEGVARVTLDETTTHAEAWTACCEGNVVGGTYYALKGKFPSGKGNKHYLIHKGSPLKVYDYRNDPCGHFIPCGVVAYDSLYGAFCPESGETCPYSYDYLPKVDVWRDGSLVLECAEVCSWSEEGQSTVNFPALREDTTYYEFTDYSIHNWTTDSVRRGVYALDVGLSMHLATGTVYYRWTVRRVEDEFWEPVSDDCDDTGCFCISKGAYRGKCGRDQQYDLGDAGGNPASPIGCINTLQTPIGTCNCNDYALFNRCFGGTGAVDDFYQLTKPKFAIGNENSRPYADLGPTDVSPPPDCAVEDCNRPEEQQNGNCAGWTNEFRNRTRMYHGPAVFEGVAVRLILPAVADEWEERGPYYQRDMVLSAMSLAPRLEAKTRECGIGRYGDPRVVSLGPGSSAYATHKTERKSLDVRSNAGGYYQFRAFLSIAHAESRWTSWDKILRQQNTCGNWGSRNVCEMERNFLSATQGRRNSVWLFGTDIRNGRTEELFHSPDVDYLGDWACDGGSLAGFEPSATLTLGNAHLEMDDVPIYGTLVSLCTPVQCGLKAYGIDGSSASHLSRDRYYVWQLTDRDDGTVTAENVLRWMQHGGPAERERYYNAKDGRVCTDPIDPEVCCRENWYEPTEHTDMPCGEPVVFQCGGYDPYSIRVVGKRTGGTDQNPVFTVFYDYREKHGTFYSGNFTFTGAEGHVYGAVCCAYFFAISDTHDGETSYRWYYKGDNVVTSYVNAENGTVSYSASCCDGYLWVDKTEGGTATTVSLFWGTSPAPFPDVRTGETIHVNCCENYAVVSVGEYEVRLDRHVDEYRVDDTHVKIDTETSACHLVDGTPCKVESVTQITHPGSAWGPTTYSEEVATWMTDDGHDWIFDDDERETGYTLLRKIVTDTRDAYLLYRSTLLVRDKRLLDLKCFECGENESLMFSPIVEDYHTAYWQECKTERTATGPTPGDPLAPARTTEETTCLHEWIPNPQRSDAVAPPDTMPENREALWAWIREFPNMGAYVAIGGELVSVNSGAETDVQEKPSPPATADLPKGEYLYMNDRNAPGRYDMTILSESPVGSMFTEPWHDACNRADYLMDAPNADILTAPPTGACHVEAGRIVLGANGVLTVFDALFGRTDYIP